MKGAMVMVGIDIIGNLLLSILLGYFAYSSYQKNGVSAFVAVSAVGAVLTFLQTLSFFSYL